MSKAGLRFLIADDHELIRQGFRRILHKAYEAPYVGEATDVHETMELARREQWSLVILDLNMPGRSGMEALRALRAEFPSLPVLVLSSYPEEQFAVRAIRAGASGYLNKRVASRVLTAAIAQVLATGHYISPQVAEHLAQALKHQAGGQPHAALSDREDQVLRLIADGQAVGEIAGRLRLSVKTISTYRAIVLRKLGLKNNSQLMRYAHEHRLEE